VPPGVHHLVYKQGKQEFSQELQIANAAVTGSTGQQTATKQNFAVIYEVAAPKGLGIAVLGGVVLGLLLLSGGFVFVIMRRRHKVFNNVPTTSTVAVAQPPVADASAIAAVVTPPSVTAAGQDHLALPPQVISPTTPQQINSQDNQRLESK
jgi:hypothetical protein